MLNVVVTPLPRLINTCSLGTLSGAVTWIPCCCYPLPLSQVSERCEGAESQIVELKVELLDMEGILSSNKNDLSSISEQLAEVSHREFVIMAAPLC